MHNKIKPIPVESWEEFSELVFNKEPNDFGRYRSDFIFRGLSDWEYPLLTSLQRHCKHDLSLENNLIRNFKKYASLEIRNQDNIWEVISLAQHHNLPTRFLDWSYSPYVALHFATEDYSSDKDGIIWCVKYSDSIKFLPKKLKESLKKHRTTSFSVDTLVDVVDSLEKLNTMQKIKDSDELRKFALFLEPHSIDSRIINQYALFMFMSDNNQNIGEWLEENVEVKKIIIPRNKKLLFRDKLDQMNMNERIIYPGLDGLCIWMRRNYANASEMYKVKKKE